MLVNKITLHLGDSGIFQISIKWKDGQNVTLRSSHPICSDAMIAAVHFP